MKEKKVIIIITIILLTTISITAFFISNRNTLNNNELLVLNEYISKSQNDEKKIAYDSILKITINPKIAYKEDEIEYKSMKGFGTDILLNNCYSFYTTYWKKLIKSYPDQTKKYIDLVKNPQADIKIKKVSGNIAIIERTNSVYEIDHFIKVDDIWYYKDDMWKKFNDFSNQAYHVKLLYLNNDDLIDAIITGGCCDTSTYNILIGNKDTIFINTENIDYHGFLNLDYKERKGSRIICKPYPEDSNSKTHIMTFNSKKNIFYK